MVKIARLERERADRVQRVWAQARRRQGRREQTLRHLVQTRPAATSGLVGTLQTQVHQQVLLAWEAAKETAAKLVAQAKKLAGRLLQAVQPDRLADWAREHLHGDRPGRSAPGRTLDKPEKPPQPPQLPKQPTLLSVSRYSLKDQYRFYNYMMDQLEAAGKVKVLRVAAKVAKRLERRQAQATRSEADQPLKPRGLLAAFRQREYDQAVEAYWQRQRQDGSLVEEAAKLQKDVLVATHRSENWAVRKLRKLQPEFVDRVERYVRGQNQQVQMAELEAQRKLRLERGVEGPERGR